MSYPITIDAGSPLPKYQQIADCLLAGIKTRSIGVEEQLPSINEISAQYDVSRDTVERAYKVLKRDGIIQSVRGKGYYASKVQASVTRRVLVLFPKLSDHKREIFEGLCERLGSTAEVDLQVYGERYARFEQLILKNKNSFSDFVLMTSFVGGNAQKAKQLISEHLTDRPLVLVSNPLQGISGSFGSVTQHYQEDIVAGLQLAQSKLSKYNKLQLLFDPDCPARGIISGFLRFTEQWGYDAAVETTETAPTYLQAGSAYLVVSDQQLVQVVKSARDQGLRLGKDVGLIAYNDSILKEVLADGITVVTTNHRLMGQRAGEMLASGEMCREQVPFRFIERSTL